MIRIVVVDNEPLVVDSLLHALEKHPELQLDVFGAYSAYEALSIMNRARVDILLTDIKMQGMSGLDLQREVAKRWPWCRTIFLTGYSDFYFVQEAIRLGGAEYLLKTERMDEIIAAVERAVGQVEDRQKSDEIVNEALSLVTKARPLLQHKLLMSLLNGRTDVADALEQFDSYEIGLSKEGVWLLYARFDDLSETHALQYDMSLAVIESVARGYFRAQTQFMQVEYSYGTFVWLLSFNTEWPERRQVYLQGVAEAVQRHLAAKLDIHVSVCVSRELAKWGDVPDSLLRLAYTLNSASSMGGDSERLNMLLMMTNDMFDTDFMPKAVRDKLDSIKQMSAYLENSAKFDFQDTLSVLTKTLANASVTARLEAYHSVLALLIKHINRWELSGFTTDVLESGSSETQADWYERMRALSDLADSVFEAKRQSGAKAGGDLVTRINRYVENNLGGDLSLFQLGEIEGMNPYYLARLYKNLTGEHLKSYINEMRASKACEMLRQGELLNREIALCVGFQTEQSFYRFFKKMRGVTPGNYR